MIELDRVAYSYGGGELFSDVSLNLAPGSFQFLTGPSGAGKTTLLKLCYGELQIVYVDTCNGDPEATVVEDADTVTISVTSTVRASGEECQDSLRV
ncbi:ATP-binding cassette domain-containing protein, partial [Marivivens sp.]|uniref:ATP-binding cassette domain-containing protein n=1 Tax=Marivivens sp. TaxID=1978374 RepID=UPI0025BA6ED5